MKKQVLETSLHPPKKQAIQAPPLNMLQNSKEGQCHIVNHPVARETNPCRRDPRGKPESKGFMVSRLMEKNSIST
jgi:hypothetical protein